VSLRECDAGAQKTPLAIGVGGGARGKESGASTFGGVREEWIVTLRKINRPLAEDVAFLSVCQTKSICPIIGGKGPSGQNLLRVPASGSSSGERP